MFQGNDLTQYNGWLIIVQPYLNGSRPDIIIFNPRIGVQIFEVKDWCLDNYSFVFKGVIDKGSKVFCFSNRNGMYRKLSPVEQVQYYKEKIIGQLVPQIGERVDKNDQLYGLIKTAVYFHKSTTAQAQDLFKWQVKDFSKFPIIGYDALMKNNLDKVIPDHHLPQSFYWLKEWNQELLSWFKPPFHSIEQSILLELNGDQKKFGEPQTGHYRVRGVAGSGKTQVLAYRAAKLASQECRVLILTFNLTLGHLIRDMIKRSPFAFHWRYVTITYFHDFCKSILTHFDEVWPQDNGDTETFFRETVTKKVLEVIKGQEYEQFDAILIDEGQDFCIDWYSMLCEFLTDRDEVVVVCDKKQNIYGIELAWLDKRVGKRVDGRSRAAKFQEQWIELKKIIRLPEQVAKISQEFSEIFNLNQDIKIGSILKPDLFNQFEAHVVWWNIDEFEWLGKVDQAFAIIKEKATHNHPSDTVILLPDTHKGFTCVQHFESKRKLSVNHVFEQGDDKKYHRHKKAFWMGDSGLKMSTIHSFKGWEVPNVIVVIPNFIPGDVKLYDNLVYTAMTRSRENLIIINANDRYWEFGERYPHEWRD